MLNIGTVGTSSIMEIIQDSISKTEGLTCKVVYSRDLQRGQAFAARMGVPEACDDYEAMIRREDLDVIYIASPNVFHKDQAIRALNQGKHVIVEKPAGINEEEVECMYAAAKANGVYFFEAITTICMPNYQFLKNLAQQLGKIHHAEINFGRYSSKYDDYLAGKNPNIFNPQMKAGALNDMGIYCVHAAIDLFGRPEKVSYKPDLGPNGIDLSGVLTLEYPSLICQIGCSKDHDIDCKCRVEGENGWAEATGLLHEVGPCTAVISGKQIAEGTPLPLKENRMIYEHARFRDAIMQKNEAFFEHMYKQSKDAAYVLGAAVAG